MRNVIFIVSAFLVIALVSVVVIAGRQETLGSQLNKAFDSPDSTTLERGKAAFDGIAKDAARDKASARGDTYCGSCDKVSPGVVRICTYCGQYID